MTLELPQQEPGRLQQHPFSRGFQWRERGFGDLRLLDVAEIGQFNRDGYVILKGALDRQTVARLVAKIDPIEAGLGDTRLVMEGDREFLYKADEMSFTKNLVLQSPLLREFFCSALFQNLCHDLIGDDVRLYWDQAVYKKPGKAKLFPWHQDNGYTFAHPEDYLTCWIALSDASVDHGCPWLVPGLHRMGTLIHDDRPEGLEVRGIDKFTGVAAPVSAGDIVVFSSLTPHKTGANITAEPRKALIAQYMAAGTYLLAENGKKLPQNDPDRHPWLLKDGCAYPR